MPRLYPLSDFSNPSFQVIPSFLRWIQLIFHFKSPHVVSVPNTLGRFFLLLLFPVTLYAQEKILVKGKITDDKNRALVNVTIEVKNENKSFLSDSTGVFSTSLEEGTYVFIFSHIGYKSVSKTFTVNKERPLFLNIALKQDVQELAEVKVTAKSKAQEVKETSFSLTVIETKKFENTTTDINQILNKSTGVRVRESGGLGSDFNFSLNGFSGNQVKFFLDGIPMDNFGSSLTLNNIPPNLASRIEVYKGVVPVHLGADALGGAVNLVTKTDIKSYVDASYSFGSFNTHRAMLLSRYVSNKNYVLNANMFYNYSDNDYWINAQVPNPNTGKIGEPVRVQRFHDTYQSATAQLEFGVREKKYADFFLLGLIFSTNYKEVQQGANMTKVAGEIFTTEKVFIPTLKYKKENLFIKGLTLNAYASYNFRNAMTVDTSSRIYDWYGNYTVKKIEATSGELTWDKTFFTFKDEVAMASINLTYKVNQYHTFSLNNNFSRFSRVGEDPISYTPIPYNSPNILTKNISGLSYQLDLFSRRWSTIVFVKAFSLQADLYEHDWDLDVIVPVKNSYFHQGFGGASSFVLFKWLQLKASVENTYRLPEGYEIFGDGLLLEGNAGLGPEKSLNANVGFLLNTKKNKHKFSAEANAIYRTPENLIRLVAVGVTSHYENLRSALIKGMEGGVQYSYNNRYSVELNATYQDIINNNKYEGSALSYLYLDRLPNIPFFFANAATSCQFDNIFVKQSKFVFDYSFQFVEAFYLKWPSQGASNSKYDIPRQITHDVALSYSLKEGKYNWSFSCLNLFDAKRYDNFMLQKPGRSFSVKFRCFFSAKQATSSN